MHVRKIVSNLAVPSVEESKKFYTDFLGLANEEFNLGWVARFTAPDGASCVQLVTQDQTSPADSAISVMVDDVDAAFDDAVKRGFDIVHPLTTEVWGVRRFLVRAPDGNVVNIVQHHS